MKQTRLTRWYYKYDISMRNFDGELIAVFENAKDLRKYIDLYIDTTSTPIDACRYIVKMAYAIKNDDPSIKSAFGHIWEFHDKV